MKIIKTQLMWLLILLLGCDAFETNPYAIRLDDHEKDLTEKQLDKLRQVIADSPIKETITIAFISDSQRALDEFEAGIDHINMNSDVDMVFHGGDITDYGLNIEYQQMGAVLRKLKAPFFTAFGNHDALATGISGYQNMFGELDYSFEAWGHKFIFFNGNHLEFVLRGEEAPDFDFLNTEIAEVKEDKNIFLISHMGPFHYEFGDANSEAYHNKMLSDSRIKLSLHGHGNSHKYGELYGEGFNYLQVDDTASENYILLTIQSDGSYEYERIFY